MCKNFLARYERTRSGDEHLGYDLLTKHLEKTDIDDSFNDNEAYVFIGFSHLSSNQINFLRALGRRYVVNIPIGKRVLKEHRPSDWTSWISEGATRKVSPLTSSQDEKKATIYRFPKGNMGEALTRVESPFQNIVFPVNSLSSKHLLELPGNTFQFKVPSELIDFYYHDLFDLWEENFFYDISKSYKTCHFLEVLEKKIEITSDMKKSFKFFAKLKVTLVFINNIKKWQELSDANDEMTHFDFKILKESVQLDLPRLFNIPLQRDYDFECFGLQNLFKCFLSENLICLSSDHELGNGEGNHYPFDVNEVLKTLGPVRQKTLDSLIVKDQLISLARSGRTSFLMENGIEEHDTFIESFLRDFSFDESPLQQKKKKITTYKKEEENIQALPQKVECRGPSVLSPTRLQSYLDCPKKYDYNYNLGLGVEPDNESLIDPRSLGSLEHIVFEKLMSSSKNIETIIQEEVGAYFSSGIVSNEISLKEITAEVKRYVLPVKDHFDRLRALDPQMKFLFEQSLNHPEANGRIDLIVISHVFGNMLIDMKRSSSSIPLKSAMEKVESIQVWYYLNYVKDYEISTFGYLSFAEPESSLFISTESNFSSVLSSQNFLGIKKIEKLKRPIDDYLLEFRDLYKEASLGVQKNLFPIKPKNAGACMFCPGSLICPKI